MVIDKELEALLLKKLKNEYTERNLRSAMEEALASATIAKKREDEKDKQIDEWYDALIEHLDTGSLTNADVGLVAALAYNTSHPNADLVKLSEVKCQVNTAACKIYEGESTPNARSAKPVQKWEIHIVPNDDPIQKFLRENHL